KSGGCCLRCTPRAGRRTSAVRKQPVPSGYSSNRLTRPGASIHDAARRRVALRRSFLVVAAVHSAARARRRMELEVTDFDLPMAIDNALTLIRERAARRSIALHTTVDERLRQVPGDEPENPP